MVNAKIINILKIQKSKFAYSFIPVNLTILILAAELNSVYISIL